MTYMDYNYRMEHEHYWDDDLTRDVEQFCTAIDRDEPESTNLGYRGPIGNTEESGVQCNDTKEILMYKEIKKKLLQQLTKTLTEKDIEFNIDYNIQIMSFDEYISDEEDRVYVEHVVLSTLLNTLEDLFHSELNVSVGFDAIVCVNDSPNSIHPFFYPCHITTGGPLIILEFNQHRFNYLDLQCLCTLLEDIHNFTIQNQLV